ncbi:hypothetical protein COLO4_01833 [Corchorus olitorius]|uniref:Pollen Ole e 1 allergen/extensin n=1 Tax=Corchorus olitorius TaxID=93759 RepID=A0A1R3L234_9ROSI|nr:hypothetical protein COLO4_01833 [Corchorus olitorius]
MTKMIKKGVLALAIIAASPHTLAQYANVEGTYSSPGGLFLQVIVLDIQKGDIAATTTVVQGACSGTVAGLGKVVGRKMTFTPFTKEENGEACTITVEFDKPFKHGKIKGESCMVYSGVACGWEGGTVTKGK